MDSNYKTRITSIVDKIVDSKNEFKKKTLKQQTNDKNDIVDELTEAMSMLNDVGKGLVLDELDAMADRNLLEFFDNKGNISLIELMYITSSVVNATIERAQRDGINLTKAGRGIETNEAVLQSALTDVAISKMIDDYENLSYEGRKQISDNWTRLSAEQVSIVMKKTGEEARKKASSVSNTETRRNLDNVADLCEDYIDEDRRIENLSIEDAIEEIEDILVFEDDERKKEWGKWKEQKKSPIEFLKQIKRRSSREVFDLTNDVLSEKISSKDVNRTIMEIKNRNETIQYLRGAPREKRAELRKARGQQLIEMKEQDKKMKIRGVSRHFRLPESEVEKLSYSELSRQYQEYVMHSTDVSETINQEKREDVIDEIVLGKIESIPGALANTKFPEEDIEKSMLQYVKLFRDLGAEDIDELKIMSTEDFSETLREILIEGGMHEQMAEIFSSMTFGGKIQQILSDEDSRKMFLEKLESTIEKSRGEDQKGMPIKTDVKSVLAAYIADKEEDMLVGEFTEHQKQTIAEINYDKTMQDDLSRHIGRNKTQFTFNILKAKHLFRRKGSREGVEEGLRILNCLGKDTQRIDEQKVVDDTQAEEARADD